MAAELCLPEIIVRHMMPFEEVHGLDDPVATPMGQDDGNPFPYQLASDIVLDLDTRDFVEGLLCEGDLSVLYGPSNSRKSFLAMDIGLHIATGSAWFGREVEEGAIIYVAAEGGQGIARRILAFRQHYGIEKLETLALLRVGIDLLGDDTDADRLIDTARQFTVECGLPVRLIVIDTLARVMGSGDENAPGDMGAVINKFDKVRGQTGAHLMVVHHSGKDQSRGARGHTKLRCAIDTELEITPDEVTKSSTVKVTKQRDLDLGEDFAFTLKVIELGSDRRGNPITSCVVEPSTAAPRNQARMSPQQKLAFQQLETAIIEHGYIRHEVDFPAKTKVVHLSHWRERLERTAMLSPDNKETATKQWRRFRTDLQSRGFIRVCDDHVWIV